MMMIGNTVVLIRNHHHLVKRRVRALKFLYMLLASVRTGHHVLKGFFHGTVTETGYGSIPSIIKPTLLPYESEGIRDSRKTKALEEVVDVR